MDLAERMRSLAEETAFSGVVRVDVEGRVACSEAYGLAHRGWQIPNAISTRFATASATKSLTALTVVSLIADGDLELGTHVRSILGDDLPLIDDAVTVEHLLAHRSGIGDYFDEDEHPDVEAYLLPVPVHQLDTAEAYLAVLDGFPQKFPPGDDFAYNNGGYAVLAVVAERVAGVPFADLVDARVCRPAGMTDTAFLRSDALPGGTATGYLGVDGLRTNILHLPVLGTGDGGIYTTAADVHVLWEALFAGRIVSHKWVGEMVRPRSRLEDGPYSYGLGFWLPEAGGVMMEGMDAGVSFRSVHNPQRQVTFTVISNTTDGAWPLTRDLALVFNGDAPPQQ